MQFRLLVMASVAFLPIAAHGRAATAVEGPSAQPASIAIVELFTSEGCSSCPPADRLLQQVHLNAAASGQLVVGISEHVTYWNSLGWKDPFSQDLFTRRQEAYASRFATEGPYTPQMVVNGRSQFVGSNRHALEQALAADARSRHAALKIVSSTVGPERIHLRFSVEGNMTQAVDVIAVVADDLDHSEVLRGENSGASLQHVSVARSMSVIATVRSNTDQSIDIPVPREVRHDSHAGRHLILFAQEKNQGAILGAAILPL
jgi:hypothetical protein